MTKLTRVGIRLALGYSTKEISTMEGKSFHTINQQRRILYQKYECRNLADITCSVISQITDIPVREILLNTLQTA
jgi:DNA-binding NarL/FixJ family response regulator